MARQPTNMPAPGLSTVPSTSQSGIRLKAFLIAVMGILSVVVFALGMIYRSVLWLWLGFICALITGVFVQILLNRREKENAEDSDDQGNTTGL